MKLEEKLAEESIAVDEQKARNHLIHRQELMEQSSHLEIRIKELTSDLKQLEALEIKVEAKLLENEIVIKSSMQPGEVHTIRIDNQYFETWNV